MNDGRDERGGAMSADVVVLGSANMDLVTRQQRLPRPGETIAGAAFATGAGGKGLNQAVAAARAGARVAFIGAVGDDVFGARLRDALTTEGIDARCLRTVAEPTGVAQVSVLDGGENSIVVVAGANATEELTESDREMIGGARYLVVQLERPVPLVAEALRYARARGVTTVLTPAPVVDGAADLVPLADILVPNETEAVALSGEADVDAAARSLSLAAGVVVATRGPRGAVVARSGELTAEVPARATVALDTTAAGDTFAGALVGWLAGGVPWDGALRAATVAASLAVESAGAAPSIPDRACVEAVLSRSEG
jgi:ribokinase